MFRQLATFFLTFLASSLFSTYHFELNTSYDTFRGLPDGSWNGNFGQLIEANGGVKCKFADLFVGGSYGLYNWDGRGNVVFANPKQLEQIAFITAGAASSFGRWSAGVAYDRLFTKNFGIYCVDPTFDQLRFKGGYTLCREQVGFWGTAKLTQDHQIGLGIPLAFQAIGQINAYWTHFFTNTAETTVWLGLPYNKSLMFKGKRPGNLIAGFTFRAPLSDCLILEGNGSYMFARHSHGNIQSRNYAAALCLGITYRYGCKTPFLPTANHSYFIVDTNGNQ